MLTKNITIKSIHYSINTFNRINEKKNCYEIDHYYSLSVIEIKKENAFKLVLHNIRSLFMCSNELILFVLLLCLFFIYL